MPYGVKKNPGGSGWLKYKKDTGKVVSHHTSKEKAEASIRAYYANKTAAAKEVYKSKAQQRFMHAAEQRGEIKKKSVEKRDKNTNFSKLPEKKASIKEAILGLQKEAACGEDNSKKKKKTTYIKKMLRGG